MEYVECEHTPVFLPGESQGWRSLVGCRLWGHTESDIEILSAARAGNEGVDSRLCQEENRLNAGVGYGVRG